MANNRNIHNSGYETAYQELCSIIDNESHPGRCGECRPCGVIQEVMEVLMETLAGKLTQDEFYTLAILLARTGTSVKDSEGRTRVDWWGKFNNAVNEDGTYDWPEGGADV